MALKSRKTVWPLDSRWLRVEYFDNHDQPLGYVNFEPNPKQYLRARVDFRPGRASRFWLACSMASALVSTSVFLTFLLTN